MERLPPNDDEVAETQSDALEAVRQPDEGTGVSEVLSRFIGPIPMLLLSANSPDDDEAELEDKAADEDEEATIKWGDYVVGENGLERFSGDAMTITFHDDE